MQSPSTSQQEPHGSPPTSPRPTQDQDQAHCQGQTKMNSSPGQPPSPIKTNSTPPVEAVSSPSPSSPFLSSLPTPPTPPQPHRRSPHVIIVGGGIGGVMLAILLERAKIQFSLLERSATPRLLGSAMALGPGVLPLFSQLGLLQEIQEHSRPVTRGMVWSEKLVPIMDLDHTTTGKRYGYLTRVIARPKLYQILMTQVPSERVFMGKKVTAFSQHSEASVLNKPGFQPGVTVICEDGDEFRGDLLVGADGAYSAIRQLLYQQIELKYGVQSDRETMAAGLGTEDLLKSETNTTGPTLPTPPPTLNGQSEGASTPLAQTLAAEHSGLVPLLAQDKEQLSITSTCLVGQTLPGLDKKTFRFVQGTEECKVGSVIGDNKPFSWSVFSMPDDSICWMVTEHLPKMAVGTPPQTPPLRFSASPSPPSSAPPTNPSSPTSSPRMTPSPSPSRRRTRGSSQSYSPSLATPTPTPVSTFTRASQWGGIQYAVQQTSSSEWGPDKVDIMCDQVKDFPIPCGRNLTMKDLIDATPRAKISKVMLEEKLFETWYSGRVVLIGDACHKLNPSAGLGAVAAIQDAAILADLIYKLPHQPSDSDIAHAFYSYRLERFPVAQQSYETSYQMSHLTEQSWISHFIRKVMNNLPKWIWYRVLDRMYEYRPQVSFLPRVVDQGEIPPLPASYSLVD